MGRHAGAGWKPVVGVGALHPALTGECASPMHDRLQLRSIRGRDAARQGGRWWASRLGLAAGTRDRHGEADGHDADDAYSDDGQQRRCRPRCRRTFPPQGLAAGPSTSGEGPNRPVAVPERNGSRGRPEERAAVPEGWRPSAAVPNGRHPRAPIPAREAGRWPCGPFRRHAPVGSTDELLRPRRRRSVRARRPTCLPRPATTRPVRRLRSGWRRREASGRHSRIQLRSAPRSSRNCAARRCPPWHAHQNAPVTSAASGRSPAK